jgi:dTDP-4-dehydrorhamnose 3,5-epimerase
MSYEFVLLEIKGLVIIKPKEYYYESGFFMESYTKKDFVAYGIRDEFVQDNHSWSIKNILRGLHFQKKPYAQSKLVRCISREILDVAVDIRKNSRTFGRHVMIKLLFEDKEMLYIPEGFAHGFLVLSDYAEVLYKVSRFYRKDHDSGIIWNDEGLGINWSVKNPILSQKDRNLSKFKYIKREMAL